MGGTHDGRSGGEAGATDGAVHRDAGRSERVATSGHELSDQERDADERVVHEQPAVGRHELPGRIPVEEYHAYHHDGRWEPEERPLRRAGDDVDVVSADERLVYEVDFRESGPHEVGFHVAGEAPFGGGKLGVVVDGEQLARYAVPPTGGWDEWETVSATLELPRGVHELALVVLEGGWKLQWIDIR